MAARRFQAGFTLVELLIVIALVVMLASGVQLVLNRPLETARLRNSMEQFRNADALLRHACRKQGTAGSLEIDVGKKKVSWSRKGTSSDLRQITLYGLVGIRSPLGGQNTWSTKVDRWGRSESFAVKFEGKHFHRWLVCCGSSGQILELEDDASIESLFAKIANGDVPH